MEGNLHIPYWQTWATDEPLFPTGRPLTFTSSLADPDTSAHDFIARILGPIEDAAAAGAPRVASSIVTPEGCAASPMASKYTLTTGTYPMRALEVRDTPGKGRGLFVTEPVKQGSIVFAEYPHVFCFQEFAMPDEDELLDAYSSMLAVYNASVDPEAQECMIRRAAADKPFAAAALCDHCFAPLHTAADQLAHMQLLINTEAPGVPLSPAAGAVSAQSSCPLQPSDALLPVQVDTAAFPALHAPAYCSPACRAAALATHAPFVYPARALACSDTPVEEDKPTAWLCDPSPALAEVLSRATASLSAAQWTTGLRALRLWALLLARLRTHAETRAHAQVPGDGDDAVMPWWSRLCDADWAHALQPFSSFARPSYSAMNGGVPLGADTLDVESGATDAAVVTAGKEETMGRAEGTEDEGAVEAEDVEEDAEEDEDGEDVDVVRQLHGLLCEAIDTAFAPHILADSADRPEAFSADVHMRPSDVLCPLLLLDRLLGAMASNTQLLGVLPPLLFEVASLQRRAAEVSKGATTPKKRTEAKKEAVQLQQRADQLLRAWAGGAERLQGNKELSASALITGMFPWHACMNHSCRPSAIISPALHCAQLLPHLPSPLPRSLAPCVFVRALRDLRAGDELTISYVDELTPDPNEYAQAMQARAKAAKTGNRKMSAAVPVLLRDSDPAPTAALAAQEVELAEAVQARFGWECMCGVCSGRRDREGV